MTMRSLACSFDNGRTLRLKTFLICLLQSILLVTSLGFDAFADDRAIRDPALSTIEEFDVARYGDLIILPVTIRGKAYPFALATNSERSVIDASMRPLFGKSLGQKLGRDGADRWEEYAPIAMKIGKSEFTPAENLQCASLETLAELTGHDMRGLLGLDFLRGRIIQIDFDEGIVRVQSEFANTLVLPDAPANPIAGGAGASPSTILKLDRYGWYPFLIDTSFTGAVVIESREINELIDEDAAVEEQPDLFTSSDGRQKVVRAGRLRGLATLRGRTVRNVSFLAGESTRIGLAYLSRFQVTLDFKHNHVYLIPGRRFDEPENELSIAAAIVRRNNQATVIAVTPTGPADVAGIQAGDVVVKVDGISAMELSLFQLRESLGKAGKHAIELRRADRSFRVDIGPVQMPRLTVDGPDQKSPERRR